MHDYVLRLKNIRWPYLLRKNHVCAFDDDGAEEDKK